MRILIIGNSGTGKSILAERLGRELQISVSHLDLIAWSRNFRRTPEAIFRQKLASFLKNRNFIMEGWALQSTMKERFAWAQVIIYLAYPKTYCLKAVSDRSLEYNNRPYPYDAFEGDRLSQVGFYNELIGRIHDEYEPEVQVWLKELEDRKVIYTFYNRDDLETNYPVMVKKIRSMRGEQSKRQN